MTKLPFVLAIVLSVAWGEVFADPLPQDGGLNWLKTMAFAAHQTDYSGTFVYQYGNHVQTLRITHIADRNGEHSRLESLDGVRREIIRDNGIVWSYLGDNKVRVGRRNGGHDFPALLPEQITLLGENYNVSQAEEGESRVAGFHTHVVTFRPKDNLRYTHKMWAHSDSGLLLKAAILDERGNIIEQYAFTQLNIGGNIDRSWMMPGKTVLPGPGVQTVLRHHLHSHSHPLPSSSPSSPSRPVYHQEWWGSVPTGWRVDALPEGFRKMAEVLQLLPGKKEQVIHLAFSDGLAGISVFIEDMDTDEDDQSENNPGLSSQGAVQVYRKVVDNHLVTVVGEVPPRTVIQVADSVRYAGK
jgi:sigma-E factor negative regulatory protein RseB